MAKKSSGSGKKPGATPKVNFGKVNEDYLQYEIEQTRLAREETTYLEDAVNDLSSSLLGISGSGLFSEMRKDTNQIKEDTIKMHKAYDQVQIKQNDMLQNFSKSFADIKNNLKLEIPPDVQKFFNRKDLSSLDLSKQQKFMEAMNSEAFSFLDTIGNASDKFKVMRSLVYSKSPQKAIDELVNSGKLSVIQSEKLMKFAGANKRAYQESAESLKIVSKEYADARHEAEQLSKKTLDISGYLNKLARAEFLRSVDNLFIKNSDALADLQKRTGEFMGTKSGFFAPEIQKMNMEIVRFGQNAQFAGDIMEGMKRGVGALSANEMRDLAGSAAMISTALGVGASEITNIRNELYRSGKRGKELDVIFEKSNRNAKLLGVSTRQVTEQISKNIEKMRQMGFKGGIESLSRMAVKAESLRIQTDEIFDLSSKSRTIEGALDMASQLQLAGGSFSNINPMDLLAAARKGPEELNRILNQMGSDIGKFNEKTGEFEFGSLDVDRLNIVAEATGLSIDSLQKRIQKNAEINRSTNLFPESMFKGAVSGLENLNIDSEMARASLSEMTEFDQKTGTIKIKAESADLFKQAGIVKLENMNEFQLKNLLKIKDEESKRLEEQAKQNMSLSQTFQSLRDSFINIFTIFEPAIQLFTKAVQKLSDGLHWVTEKWGAIPATFLGLFTLAIPSLLKGAVFKAFGGVGGILSGAFGKAFSVAKGKFFAKKLLLLVLQHLQEVLVVRLVHWQLVKRHLLKH